MPVLTWHIYKDRAPDSTTINSVLLPNQPAHTKGGRPSQCIYNCCFVCLFVLKEGHVKCDCCTTGRMKRKEKRFMQNPEGTLAQYKRCTLSRSSPAVPGSADKRSTLRHTEEKARFMPRYNRHASRFVPYQNSTSLFEYAQGSALESCAITNTAMLNEHTSQNTQ